MTVPGAPSGPSFCTACGTPAADTRFCTGCGAAVAPPAVAPPAVASSAAGTPAAEASPHPVAAPLPAAAPEAVTQVFARPPEPTPPPEPFAPPGTDSWFDEVADAEVPAGQDDPPDDSPYGRRPHDVLLGTSADDGQPYDRPSRSGRRGTWLAVAFFLLVALSVGGVFGYRWYAARDVRSALAASTADYNAVVEQLTAAGDVTAVSAAAGRAEQAASAVARQQARLGDPDDARGRAAARQLDAEHEVLLAVAPLADLEDEPLQTWADVLGPLRDAVDEEQEAREALDRQDPEVAGRIAEGDEMLEALTGTVGTALADDASGGARTTLDLLAEATRTSQLREIGTAARGQQDAVASVATALGAEQGGDVLTAYAELLAALGGLSDLTPDDTTAWDDVRGEVEAAAGRLAAASGAQGGPVRTSATAALRATDALVVRVDELQDRFRQARDEAESQLAQDRSVLQSYEQEFTSAMDTYATGREELGAFTDRLEDGTADVFEGASAFSVAVGERQSVASLLDSLDVPEGVRSEHDAVAGLVARGEAAAESGYEGLAEAGIGCFETTCPDYASTAGWQAFLDASEVISKQYDPVLTAWQSAVAQAGKALDARALPAQPDL